MSTRVRPRGLPVWLADPTIALVVAVLELVNLLVSDETPYGVALDAVLLVATAAPLLLRRRHPIAVGFVVAAIVIALAALGIPHLGLAVLVALYGVAAYTSSPARPAFAALALSATIVVPFVTPDSPADIPRNLALYAAAWVLGTLHRQRAAYTGELEERTRQLLAQREENARLAAEVERGRIARELHDVVAHALSVMVVQTGAARAVAAEDPRRADGLLARVEVVGRESLAELRRVLGRLRTTEDPAPLAPHPGVASLEELLCGFREAGLPVTLDVTGAARPLAASVDLAAYRIVQEGLTNALKHADRPTRVLVSLDYRPAELAVEVSDDAAQRADSNGAGHGLRGIRERAALLGGSACSGPAPGGGFRVAAVLPDERA